MTLHLLNDKIIISRKLDVKLRHSYDAVYIGREVVVILRLNYIQLFASN